MVSPQLKRREGFRPQELRQMLDSIGVLEREGFDYWYASPEGSWIRIGEVKHPTQTHPTRTHRPFVCPLTTMGHGSFIARFVANRMMEQGQSWDSLTSTFADLAERHGCTIWIDPDPAPSRRETPTDEYERGKQYYEMNKAELEARYPGEYIAIWNGEIISHGESFSDVATEAYKHAGYRDMFIPKVGPRRRPARFPAPRRPRK